MDKKIQLFSPYFRTDECLAQIKECLDKGWTGLGYKTVEFGCRNTERRKWMERR